MTEELYFETITEARDGYYVEYKPMLPGNAIASIYLVFPGDYRHEQVTALMEAEMLHWLSRYPVPTMLWAYDSKENPIHPRGEGKERLINGWIDRDTHKAVVSWDFKGASTHMNAGPIESDWGAIYSDIPFKTSAMRQVEIAANVRATQRHVRVIRGISLMWLAVGPAAWAIFEYAGPEWVGLAILIYSLWKAVQEGRRIYGHKKRSKAEEDKAEKERKQAYYFYHCERNQTGFARLMVENLEKDAEERVRREAGALGASKQVT